MHRYQPRLHVIHINSSGLDDKSTQNFKTFSFTETQFTAVTAYQNHRVSRINEFERNLSPRGARNEWRNMRSCDNFMLGARQRFMMRAGSYTDFIYGARGKTVIAPTRARGIIAQFPQIFMSISSSMIAKAKGKNDIFSISSTEGEEKT